MRITLRQGSKTFELGKFSDGSASTSYRDASSAERFLRAFKNDPGTMAKLRRFATELSGSELSRGGDDRALRVVAQALASGRVQLGGSALRRAVTAPKPEEVQAAPPPPTTSSSSPSSAPSEPSMFGADFDAAAQAEVLKKAADSGVPFCEECERRRQEREAA